jgi:hypothetical protein
MEKTELKRYEMFGKYLVIAYYGYEPFSSMAAENLREARALAKMYLIEKGADKVQIVRAKEYWTR